MTSFEYLSVLISIVLALGVTHLLTGLSSILRSEGKVRLCWIQLAWSLAVMAFQISVWWAYWDFRDRESWGLFQFSSLLVLPGLTYLAARILMPDVIRDDSYDLRAHFDKVRQEFFSTLFLALLFALVFRTVFFGETVWAAKRAPLVLMALVVPSGALVSDRRWQSALVLLVIAVWVGSVVFLWGDLRHGA